MSAVPDRRALRVLGAVALTNGAVCIGGATLVVFRPERGAAPVGDVVYVAAVIVLTLTPLQLLSLWLVLRRRLIELWRTRILEQQVAAMLERPALQTAFQPILSLDARRVCGVEALSRFTAEPAHPPDAWFRMARQVGRGGELELLALRTALAAGTRLPEHLYLAVNVSPGVLVRPELLPTLLDAGISPSRLMVEITEHETVTDYQALREARERLRAAGIRLAVDDAGAGYASFHHIVVLAPDLIKLDRVLIAGIERNPAQQALVASVVAYAAKAQARVVGEGVETSAELDTLTALGVEAAQGYLLGRPTVDEADWAGWAAEPIPT